MQYNIQDNQDTKINIKNQQSQPQYKDKIKLSIEKKIYNNDKTILIIIQVSRPNGVLLVSAGSQGSLQVKNGNCTMNKREFKPVASDPGEHKMPPRREKNKFFW